MKGPGGRFERQVLASVPRWAYGRKVPDPPARPFKCRCGGDIAPRCSRCGSQHGHPATFTRGNPWDIEIRWRGSDMVPVAIVSPIGRLAFEMLLECKSTAGGSLRWDSVKPDELAKASEAGSFAGVLWECRAGAEHVCHYLPIHVWLRLADESPRKSCPLAIAAAYGIRVEVDEDRGRTHTYYRLGDLMRRLAGVETAEAPRQVALFGA